MYYLLIAIATVMFGVQFFLNKQYQKKEGTSLEKAVIFSAGTSFIIAIVMLVINKFRFEFSLFSFGISAILSVNSLLFTYCSAVAMTKVNLALYSLFAMLGGMLLPCIAGICFWNEPFTLYKAISIVIITAALSLGENLKTDKKSLIYSTLVFILNGMAGVLSKIHQSYPSIHISSAGFMLLKSLVTLVMCLMLLPFLSKDKMKIAGCKNAVISIGGFGFLNGIANFFVLVALLYLAASVQYPMITAGTIVTSTVIAFLSKEKVTYKNIIATMLAVIGTLFLL